MSELNDPSSFGELWGWLDAVIGASNSPFLLRPPEPEQWRSVGDVQLWLIGNEPESPSQLEGAARSVWLHREGAFAGLPPFQASLLRVRIQTATDWIEELAANENTPLAYPSEADFRDLVDWLLTDWWKAVGRNRAAVKLFLLPPS